MRNWSTVYWMIYLTWGKVSPDGDIDKRCSNMDKEWSGCEEVAFVSERFNLDMMLNIKMACM